ncbi:MAG: PH domain-containing protein [Anaerolineaceae bacterium]
METTYTPDRTKGLRVIFLLAGLLTALIVFFMLRSGSEKDPTLFLIWVGLAVVLTIPLVLLLYRAYTLGTIRYSLSRDSLDLRWGLHRELIPLNRVEWARPLSDFESKLPLPWFSLPGSIFSSLDINGLGRTQFISANSTDTILVHANNQTFVISPQNLNGFVQEFRRYSEIGQKNQVQPISTSFRTVWSEIWHDQRAKTFIWLGLILVGVAWLSAIGLIATFQEVTWVDLTKVPSNRLVLLAILAVVFWVADLWTGLFYYLRGNVSKPLIYLIWGSSSMISLILIVAMFLMTV